MAGRNAPHGLMELIPGARLLRAKLDELISGRCGEDSVSGMRAILEFAAPHLRFELDPAIWSRLPEEVWEVIFAKLPVLEIHRLRCLSTHWKRNLVERSRFRELCAKTRPKVFALICEDEDSTKLFWVKLYDTGTNKWHLYKLIVASTLEMPFRTMMAADGGLVCFLTVSVVTDNCPLEVVVCNPLTQHMKRFVLEGLSTEKLELLQIVTDQDTGHYKLIVGSRKQNALGDMHSVVDMFDSKTEKWMNLDLFGEDQTPPRGLFWGMRYNWNLDPGDHCLGPCVWSSSALQLNELDDTPIRGVGLEEYALLKDRLFVLHEEERESCSRGDPGNQGRSDSENSDSDLENFDSDTEISGSDVEISDSDDDDDPSKAKVIHYSIFEYQGRTQRPNWVKLRTISSRPFKLPPLGTYYEMRLHACEGFLVVAQAFINADWDSPYRHLEIGWLYDLSTDKWRALPNMPGDVKLQDFRDSLLCDLRWDVDLNPLNVPETEQLFLPVSAFKT